MDGTLQVSSTILVTAEQEPSGTYAVNAQLVSDVYVSDDYKRMMESFAKKYINYIRLCSVLLRKMQSVCECRLSEGKYINRTLENAQKAILNIIKTHYKDTLRITPSFSEPGNSMQKKQFACGDVFCNPIFDDCFQLPGVPDNSTNISYVFQIIDEHLKNNQEVTSKLTMAVFGVFNAINDIPKQAYIYDTNLRILYKFFANLRIIKYALDNDLYPKNSSLMNFIKTFSSNKTDDILGGLIDALNVVLRDMKSWISYYTPDARRMYGFTKAEVTKLKQTFPENDYDRTYTPSIILDDIRRILHFIEKVNSISAMGTLEFLDSLTKYDFDHPTWTASCNPDKSSYMSQFMNTKANVKATNQNVLNNNMPVRSKQTDRQIGDQNVVIKSNAVNKPAAAAALMERAQIEKKQAKLNKLNNDIVTVKDRLIRTAEILNKMNGTDKRKLVSKYPNVRNLPKDTSTDTFFKEYIKDIHGELQRYNKTDLPHIKEYDEPGFIKWVVNNMKINDNFVVWFKYNQTNNRAIPNDAKISILHHMEDTMNLNKLQEQVVAMKKPNPT